LRPEESEKILIADDEPHIVEGLSALLEEEGYAVEAVAEGNAALDLLQENSFSLVLADLTMPGLDGLGLLHALAARDLNTEVIIITGKGSIGTAVEAMRAGAYDYLTKPVEPARLRSIVLKALEHHRLKLSHQRLQAELRNLTRYDDMVGKSEEMRAVYRLIDAVADSTASVLILGESGTGKELVARAIHRKSSRAQGPFVAINCSAFPTEILENELFGHEKGAFTGALAEKPGCFELAHGGTLFLDEVGEMPLPTQTKILRALEEKRYRRLGGRQEIEVDVRVIAATNRNLEEALAQKQLREDLYYRLCVVEIELPPLRDRAGDIPLLATEFLNRFAGLNQKRIRGFTQAAMRRLVSYAWPGNVRELRNAVERAVVLSQGTLIDVEHLPPRIAAAGQHTPELHVPVGTSVDECERLLILKTLDLMGQNKTRAAEVLGISLKTLHNKLNRYRRQGRLD